MANFESTLKIQEYCYLIYHLTSSNAKIKKACLRSWIVQFSINFNTIWMQAGLII